MIAPTMLIATLLNGTLIIGIGIRGALCLGFLADSAQLRHVSLTSLLSPGHPVELSVYPVLGPSVSQIAGYWNGLGTECSWEYQLRNH